ncbi:MAG: hypothetical protein KGR26_01865, partial [Cyanobacteria bacterium REEB65]|nr:hypothetical protein [Cyanobacteria bacterium REEB65]
RAVGFAAILVPIAAFMTGCRAGIPGLKTLSSQPASTPSPSPDQQGHLGPASPGSPYIAAISPPDAGPQAIVRLSGQNLQGQDLHVYFGSVAAASVSALPDGDIAATVPDKASSGPLGVGAASGSILSSRPFQVIAAISANLLDPTPGEVGKPLHLALSAIDTAGAPIASPDVQLVISPPGAATVSGYGRVTPTAVGDFTIQAVSGRIVQTVNSAACPNYLPLPFAGDGTPSAFAFDTASGSDLPVLSDVPGTAPGTEAGTALQAHLNKPFGMARFTWEGKTGVLFTDSGSGRLRFASDDGLSVQTLVGGQWQDPPPPTFDFTKTITTQSIPPNALQTQLYSPEGVAVGTWDGTQVVFIAETGAHDLLVWIPGTQQVLRVAGQPGQPVYTDNASGSSQNISLGDYTTVGSGIPTGAGFTDPTGLAAVPAPQSPGDVVVYVADTGDLRIRRLWLSDTQGRSTISTLIGSGSMDALGASASVDFPQGVAAIPQTANHPVYVFIADTDNDRILALEDSSTSPTAGTIQSLVALATSSVLFRNPVGVAATEDTSGKALVAVADTRADQIVVLRDPNLSDGSVADAPYASCPNQTDPANGISWPVSVLFKDVQTLPAGEDLFFGDLFSNEIRTLSMK